MIGNLKTLGLALVAILALAAMSASTAAADNTQGELTTYDGQPVTLDISEKGGVAANALTSFGGRTECPGSSYTGHKVHTHQETTQGKTHELIPNESTTATITPHYNQENCRAFSGGSEFQATVQTNGCDFVFHIGKTVSSNTYPVTADVECPDPNNGIHVSLWSSGASSHGTINRVCTVEVTPQSGLSGPHVSNGEGGHLEIAGTFTGIHVERTGLCTFGAPTTTNEGEFHINGTIEGTDDEGDPKGITVTDLRS